MILAIAVNKGGTGKTSTAACIAQAAAFEGIPTLAIDLDRQANLTFALNAKAEAGRNSFNLLTGSPAESQIQGTSQNIDVIAASPDLSTITTGRGSARRLQQALEPIKNIYGLIVIDTPTAAELQYNALQAADRALIPLQADTYNVQSLYQTADTIRQIQKTNPRLKMGMIITCYDGRSNIAKAMKQTMIDTARAADVQYLGTIRRGVAIQEAAALQESLYKYAPKSKPAADYRSVAYHFIGTNE